MSGDTVEKQSIRTQVNHRRQSPRLIHMTEQAGGTPMDSSYQGFRLHLSPDGNDACSGMSPIIGGFDGPLRSLNAAMTRLRTRRSSGVLQGPVHVILADGTYPMDEVLHLSAEDSGTADAPVSFEAAPGARPILSGGIRVTGFEPAENGLWQASIPAVAKGEWFFEQLWVNGRRATRARWPKKGWSFLRDGSQEILKPDPAGGHWPELARHTLRLQSEDLHLLEQMDERERKDVQCVIYHKWESTRRFIERLDADQGLITVLGKGKPEWNSLGKEDTWPGVTSNAIYFENIRQSLNDPGEFFLGRDGLLLYRPLPGEDMTVAEVIAPRLEQFVMLRGNASSGEFVEHISFSGLTFHHGQWVTPPGGFDSVQSAIALHAVIEAVDARRITVDDCEIGHIGIFGIWFRQGCSDVLIRHCLIHDTGAGGVRIGEPDRHGITLQKESERTMRVTVENCIIAGGGRLFPCACAVWVGHASDNAILHNEIADHGYSGVNLGFTWGYTPDSPTKRNRVCFNHIHHIGNGGLSDMGGIYCLGRSEGTVIANNVVHDVYARTYGGWGLYADEGSFGITWENNLVYNTKTTAFFMHYGKNNIVRNNILVSEDGAVGHSGRLMEPGDGSAQEPGDIVGLTDLLLEHNILYGNPFKIERHVLTEIRGNCVWRSDGKPVEYGDRPLADLERDSAGRAVGKDSGKDAGKAFGNLVADPGFMDHTTCDFRLRPESPALRVGFIPFDLLVVGVYGSQEWIGKAKNWPCHDAIKCATAPE